MELQFKLGKEAREFWCHVFENTLYTAYRLSFQESFTPRELVHDAAMYADAALSEWRKRFAQNDGD
jgi:hypothetical protein